ncbi:hypothetical protein D2N39_04860 [Gemmobacter lutimaris]|uniref:Uncharacterized protein n=1 Tax=Gemmobacter lutimaris TaxID=2306023 RepID=A0A398BYI5_9RHOB|nr:hypothetical protein [Gemmobacter lutimaris]RID92990.1 hypothetical protein D2N39_04860 [Gemmobacter lutimaris]
MTHAISVAVLSLAALLAQPVLAQDASQDGQTWTERKCALYQQAFDDALHAIGRDGIRKTFLARNTAFIEGGCTDNAKLCPETGKEIELANLLTVMTMNEGMASTFVPFGCPN